MARNISTLLASATAYAERAQTSRLVEWWSEEPAARYQLVASKVLADVAVLSGKEKANNANQNLSPTGQFDQTKRDVKIFLDSLRWLRDEKGSLATKVGSAYGDLFVLSASKLNELVQALRDMQVTGAIGALPPKQRDVEYLRASEADQIEVVRALQNSPMVLISDDVRMRGDDERAQRNDPKRYRQFIENGQLLDEISSILDDCLDLVREFVIDVKENSDELGPKVRLALEFGVQHWLPQDNEEGKLMRDTTQRDAVGVD